MHEMALAESVLQIIEDAAQKQGFRRVKTVWLEVGQLSAVEPDALRFCFDVVTRGSIADSARLDILDTPGVGWCMRCSQAVPMAALYSACPRCGSYQLQPSQGTEMRVKELDVE